MNTHLGSILKALREELGLLQRDVAIKLDMSTSGYGFYETGRRTPDAIMIHKLCDIFDVDADYLLGRSNVKKTKLDDVHIHTMQCISTEGLSSDDVHMVKMLVERLKKNAT